MPPAISGPLSPPLPSLDPDGQQKRSRLAARTADEPVRGILFVLGAGLLFSCSDAVSKFLAETIPAVEIAWMRWIGFGAAVLPMLVATRGRTLRSRAPLMQVVRSLGLLGASTIFIMALVYLPLAGATTINFVSPLIVTALSIPLLGEKVGARRWAAVLVGLAGVAIVVRPGSGTFDLAAILPVVSASCWALGVIVTRKLAGIDDRWTAMTYTAAVGLAVLSALLPGQFVLPNLTEIALAAAMAACATSAQFCIIEGFRRAPASLLAPFSYGQMIWSTALGFVVFGNLPDLWTWIGAAIIIASGIYTAHRERVRARGG